MKRGSQEINDETSPSPTQRLRCRENATVDSIHIPYDLTVGILKKLPTKSLVRFQCVSKQWSSIIGSRRDFIDAIVARSLTQPSRDTQLIFHHRSYEILSKSHFFIFSTTYPQNIDKESVSTLGEMFQYVRGLIFCWSTSETASTIYNPTTKQSLSLPEMEPGYFPEDNRFLGYDPIENQYKVMCIRTNYIGQSYQVFTLRDPTKKWRNIECNIGFHFPILLPVCINGTTYYRALIKGNGRTIVLMRFNVRSEKFCHVEAPKSLMDFSSTLINCQGKLGFMCRYKYSVEIWVMDDAEKKQECSKIIFYEMKGFKKLHIAGVTRGGEIVFVNKVLVCYQTLNVFYYDPDRNSIRDVQVEGTMVEDREHQHKRLIRIPDHVENTMRL